MVLPKAAELRRALAAVPPRLVPDGLLWLSWPKKSSSVSTDIAEAEVRAWTLPTGLVDVKVCAVDGVWSGLKFMVRKERRADWPPRL